MMFGKQMVRKGWAIAGAIAVVSCLAASAANAQSTGQDYDHNSKFYLALQGGVNWHNPVDWTARPDYGRFGSKTGYAVVGAIGFKAANNIRLELEPGYRFNRQRHSQENGAQRQTGGRVSNESVMANVLFDIPTGWAVKPYVGGGVGVTRTRLRLDNVTMAGIPVVLHGRDTVIAYQAIVGLGFQVAPRLFMTVDYRYFASAAPDFAPGTGGPWTGENHNHAVMVGLRVPFSI